MSAIPPATQYQALYRSVMKEAAAQGRTLMQRMVAKARTELPHRATLVPDAPERHLLTEAARVLMKHEAQLCEAYPQALLAEFAQAIAGDNRKAGALSFDALELMGDDQVAESVELLRTQQTVAAAVESELTGLNALVCAAQGLKSVQVERNPLRPEVYVRSLRTVLLQSPVSQEVRNRWLGALGEALGSELARAYRELSEMLRREGVSEAGFRITASAESPGLLAPKPQGEEAVQQQQATAQLNVRELRRLLAGEFDVPDTRGNTGPADFSLTMPAAFEVLQEMRQVDKVVQRLQQRQAVGATDAEGTADLRAQLRKEAGSAGAALGLEVVNLMVDNIAGDTRLLPPVQQAVRDLEPALLRLAMTDPRFFSDRRHPARQLLEQMTQRSLAWESVDAPGFGSFIDPLNEAVDALVSTRTAGAEPFDFALRSLEEAWGDQQRRDKRYREKAVRALLQAEQRNLLADKFSKELRNRSDVMLSPRLVQQFVTGPWAQVLAQARLADQEGTRDPGGYNEAVDDLTLSVQSRQGPGNAAKLARMLPPLLDKLRHGLMLIDYPSAKVQEFMDDLARLHQRAIKPPAEETRPMEPVEGRLTRAQLDAQFNADKELSGFTWVAPREARHSGFVDTDPSIAPKALFQMTQPGFTDTRPPEEADAMAATLPPVGIAPGAWVELFTDGNWARFQLTWASPHGTLFMFTNAAGKAQSMTRRLLDKMMESGSLRLVGQAVVEGALDAVANTALRNTLGSKG